ncbi:SulP family inorganic anion transporter [Rhodoblastus sp.]|uniref:SulP family inorganic anion transporter n=1 Tax=Rhodoblastus sp. TaxID=1962975 RepID=UPI003F96389D
MIQYAPGLAALLRYKPSDVKADVAAGLAVASVAIPVGVAYAELAGFSPEIGLYSSILPLVAYAIFGSSRQVIVGPDAATCALVAAAVGPLAGNDPSLYAALSVTLALLTGLFCIAASFLRLGALADFLSKPILVGFLNGVALSIVLGQIGKLLGFTITAKRIIPTFIEVLGKLDQIQLPTALVALSAFAVLIATARYARSVPASIVAMAVTGGAVALFGLEAQGVKTLGVVPGGLPALRLPQLDWSLLPGLSAEAAGLALVSFSSLMLTGRSFASKNGYEVDPDQDLAALGVANLASALSQGFTISGADSRTAVADAAGGRTQATGLVAAAVVALALVFLTGPLRYVPVPAMAAVLVMASLSLVDLGTVRMLYRIDPVEAGLSLLATVGVVAVGAVNAILFVVVLALLRFVRLVSRPRIEILGKVDGLPGFHSLARHEQAQAEPGLLFFRFNGPLVFFNASFFKQKMLEAVGEAGPSLHHVVLDMLPVSEIDATGLFALKEINDALAARGISLCAAGRATEWRHWLERRDFDTSIPIFPTLRAALRELGGSASPKSPTSPKS